MEHEGKSSSCFELPNCYGHYEDVQALVHPQLPSWSQDQYFAIGFVLALLSTAKPIILENEALPSLIYFCHHESEAYKAPPSLPVVGGRSLK